MSDNELKITHADAQQLPLSTALLVAEIHPSPTNPRKTFPEDAHAEMVKTVKRHGVMQPILVRPWPEKYKVDGPQPKYELIAGERRYRAAKSAGLEYIPGTVRDLDDHETIELQIIENLHRRDLNELEEAEGYDLAMKQFGYTADQLAEKIEKSKAYIYARLKLTAACETARQAFRDGTIDASRLLLIARIPTAELQADALKEITTSWQIHNYRQAAEHVQRRYMLKLAEAPFSRTNADLLPAAGKCQACPKRTGNNPELFQDVKGADICTDPTCFAAKKAAHFARAKEEAKAQGRTIIEGKDARKLMPQEYSSVEGHIKLDSTCYEINKEDKTHPTYRELLADKAIPVILVETPEGGLVEVVAEADFKSVAADLGIRQQSSNNDDLKKREAKAKEENEFRKRFHAQIRTALQEDIAEAGAELKQEEMALVARQFLSRTWHENQKRLAALWVQSEEKIDAHDQIRRLTAMIDEMEPANLCLFLIDLALIDMVHVAIYDNPETPAPLIDAGRRMGVSPDTIRREMQVEKEEKSARKKGKSAEAAAPAPAPAPETKQPATAEVKPGTTPPALKTGDVVVVKADAVAEGGWTLSSRGKSGTVVRPHEDPGWYIVKINDGEEVLHQDSLTFIAGDNTPTAANQDVAAAEESKPAARKTTSKVEVLYSHPKNADLKWTGRGRKPKWVEVWLEKGGTLEQLLAKKRPAHKPKGSKATTTLAACDNPTPRCTKTLDLPNLDVAQSNFHHTAP